MRRSDNSGALYGFRSGIPACRFPTFAIVASHTLNRTKLIMAGAGFPFEEMISRGLAPPGPSGGGGGGIPLLSISPSVRGSVADHNPFDRRGELTVAYSLPPRRAP